MIRSLAAAAVAAALASPAFAGTTTISVQGFDPVVPTAAGPAPNVWYVDRYAPAGFESEFFDGDNRLALTLDDADNSAGRGAQSSSFYATQGRKFDTPEADSMSIEMYIDSSFDGQGRIGGLWATAVDSGDAISYYPIVEFIDDSFYAFDSLGEVSGGFIDLGLPTGFTYDEWVEIGFRLDAGMIVFSLNGEDKLSLSAGGTVSFANVILQGINADPGVDRTIYFDNLVVTGEVPVPAALPLLAGALGLLGVAARRRRRA
ncbi:MAG: hypothetical protein VYD87_20835 [Pseudomonadota bacterium]|nr:hypothetical protein [Pseudomonadota bacterium]